MPRKYRTTRTTASPGSDHPGCAARGPGRIHDPKLRRAQQHRQLQSLRLPGEPAGPGRRRRPEPLRRDGQPRVRGVLQDRAACCSARSTSGALWAASAIADCTDPSGDPVVLYDQLADRWILTQFTTRGLDDPSLPFYNCVAISTTADPTGSYYRYAFTHRLELPGLPEVRRLDRLVRHHDARVRADDRVRHRRLRAREEQDDQRRPNARVGELLHRRQRPGRCCRSSATGCCRPTSTASRSRKTDTAIPLVGTQDDGGRLRRDVRRAQHLGPPREMEPRRDRVARAQHAAPDGAVRLGLPVRRPTARDCLPQPGITNPAQFLDILSYRQRPTWRLAYRNFKGYEALVTNQSVEAAPGVAGVRWYEIRRAGEQPVHSMYQQGTYAPNDGVHRWMGSIAMDRKGNMALGYSVVNGTTCSPASGTPGASAGDPLGHDDARRGRRSSTGRASRPRRTPLGRLHRR